MIKNFLFILVGSYSISFAQIPDSLFVKADSVLHSIGKSTPFLQYDCSLSYANYGSSRWYMCGNGDPDYAPRVKWEDFKDFIEFKIVYNLNYGSIVSNFGYIKFDMNGNFITYSHNMMPELVAIYPKIKLSERDALEIAFEAGLEWQNREIKTELDHDIDYGKDYHFYWNVLNHQVETHECDRKGKIVVIDSESGEIVLNTVWEVKCVE